MNDAPTEEGRQWLTDMDMKLVCEIATGNFYLATNGGGGNQLILCDSTGAVYIQLSHLAKHLIRPLTDVEMADKMIMGSGLFQLRDKWTEDRNKETTKANPTTGRSFVSETSGVNIGGVTGPKGIAGGMGGNVIGAVAIGAAAYYLSRKLFK